MAKSEIYVIINHYWNVSWNKKTAQHLSSCVSQVDFAREK